MTCLDELGQYVSPICIKESGFLLCWKLPKHFFVLESDGNSLSCLEAEVTADTLLFSQEGRQPTFLKGERLFVFEKADAVCYCSRHGFLHQRMNADGSDTK
jgi:hypothetical protein